VSKPSSISPVISMQYHLVTDRQTDRQTDDDNVRVFDMISADFINKLQPHNEHKLTACIVCTAESM